MSFLRGLELQSQLVSSGEELITRLNDREAQCWLDADADNAAGSSTLLILLNEQWQYERLRL